MQKLQDNNDNKLNESWLSDEFDIIELEESKVCEDIAVLTVISEGNPSEIEYAHTGESIYVVTDGVLKILMIFTKEQLIEIMNSLQMHLQARNGSNVSLLNGRLLLKQFRIDARSSRNGRKKLVLVPDVVEYLDTFQMLQTDERVNKPNDFIWYYEHSYARKVLQRFKLQDFHTSQVATTSTEPSCSNWIAPDSAWDSLVLDDNIPMEEKVIEESESICTSSYEGFHLINGETSDSDESSRIIELLPNSNETSTFVVNGVVKVMSNMKLTPVKTQWARMPVTEQSVDKAQVRERAIDDDVETDPRMVTTSGSSQRMVQIDESQGFACSSSCSNANDRSKDSVCVRQPKDTVSNSHSRIISQIMQKKQEVSANESNARDSVEAQEHCLESTSGAHADSSEELMLDEPVTDLLEPCVRIVGAWSSTLNIPNKENKSEFDQVVEFLNTPLESDDIQSEERVEVHRFVSVSTQTDVCCCYCFCHRPPSENRMSESEIGIVRLARNRSGSTNVTVNRCDSYRKRPFQHDSTHEEGKKWKKSDFPELKLSNETKTKIWNFVGKCHKMPSNE